MENNLFAKRFTELLKESNKKYNQTDADLGFTSKGTISKKTKKGMADVNVRPMIHQLFEQDGCIKATLSCSNSENLRADTLAGLLREYLGIHIGQIWREKLFIMEGTSLKEPAEIGE